MSMDAELQAANRRLARAMDKRDEWIAAMRAEGATLRAIADAARISAEGVQEVLRRTSASGRGRRGQGSRAEASVREWTRRAWEAADDRDRLIKQLVDDLSPTHSLAEIARLAGVSPTNLVYITTRRRQRLQRPHSL
ncbi:MAG: hypothetical protein ACRDWD_01825 [Acidimicrobiia bacterium]